MKIENVIKIGVENKIPFDVLVEFIKEFKKSGGSQKAAEKALTSLMLEYRNNELEVQEDIVSNLLDIITGFCHDSKKIWTGIEKE